MGRYPCYDLRLGPGWVALTLATLLISGCANQTVDVSAAPTELEPYVDFLRAGVEQPKDYILGLFENHDLVIVCERWHPEMTQYDLFYEVVSDPRFGRDVGHLFTELGSRNLQADLDNLMATPGLEPEEFDRRLLPIYRDLGLHPGWDHLNFFRFLGRLYRLNAARPAAERVRLHFTDIPIEWEEMTAEGYANLWESVVPDRDPLMADLITEQFRALDDGGASAKALVIMNYRHAFNDFSFDDGSRGNNVGRYLFERFPGRVANVMLHSLAWIPDATGREPTYEPIQKGRWDAAFRLAGVEEAGFDFADSPFGRDTFDYFSFRPHSVAYQNVFTGFVFYRPLAEHYFMSGIPGMFDDGFEEEYRRRLSLTGREFDEEDVETALAASASPIRETYDEPERLEAMIGDWLDDASK